MKVHPCTVTIPDAVTECRHDGLVLTSHLHVQRELSDLNVLPHDLNLRTAQEPHQACQRLQRLPSLDCSSPVELFEDLRIASAWESAAFQSDDVTSCLGCDLLSVVVAELAADEALISDLLILTDLVAETSHVLWQCVAVVDPQCLALIIYTVPVDP